MNSLIIIYYDLHCGTDPHEVKYFTNPFLLKTLLFVMHCYCVGFLLVVIATLYLSHSGGSNKFEKAGWC